MMETVHELRLPRGVIAALAIAGALFGGTVGFVLIAFDDRDADIEKVATKANKATREVRRSALELCQQSNRGRAENESLERAFRTFVRDGAVAREALLAAGALPPTVVDLFAAQAARERRLVERLRIGGQGGLGCRERFGR